MIMAHEMFRCNCQNTVDVGLVCHLILRIRSEKGQEAVNLQIFGNIGLSFHVLNNAVVCQRFLET